ncbi:MULTISPECIES: TIR domain-containing protein [Methanobacterium]|uniref:Thoeris protein ThsB TIR-like domain-containing protein n=1 Tax=Methanobacterium bryantii TaxID=2161 RepID=A0A2A2H7W7_METBR|nr:MULTISPECIES: TIR domain-containing protein [Methanobacterium]OEC84346.1 nuclease [Methanobacterium sp. A39]PAV05502.1 hypothetical protein ASJ80_09000 [Methanobacterium bryantii]
MPSLKTYRIFISHAWQYSSGYNRIVRMLNDASNFDWRNYSVPEHDPKHADDDDELEKALKNQMSPTHIVLVLAGMYVNHRKWIQKEIDIAQDYGKPIVGIKPWGNERTPAAVKDAADEMVNWQSSSIISAIRRNSL